VLKELGLLSLKPVEVEGARVTPKKVVDAVLYPQVRLGEHERDITTFRVDALGVKHGHACHYRIELVDRYDEALGFTSMARTTAFTAAIVARMVARGDLKASGLVTPEKLLTGAAFERLVNELAANGMRFAATTMQTQILGQSIR
jgi:saccharopine dehydrogenase-like NADP-dependent oxidoreductase